MGSPESVAVSLCVKLATPANVVVAGGAKAPLTVSDAMVLPPAEMVSVSVALPEVTSNASEASEITFPGPAATPKESVKPKEPLLCGQPVNISPGSVAEDCGVTMTLEAAAVLFGVYAKLLNVSSLTVQPPLSEM
jgi:hypothetical protein